MNLYNSFINAGRKVLVAHNRFVSVFNLTKQKWQKHYKMDDIVLQIFRNQKVGANSTGDSASNFRVGILIGRQIFRFLDILGMGRLEYKGKETEIVLDGLVDQFLVDQEYDTGFYMLTKGSGLSWEHQNILKEVNNHTRVMDYRVKEGVSSGTNFMALVDDKVSDISPAQFSIPSTQISLCVERQ